MKRIVVVNPLPRALHHYERAVLAVLHRIGYEPILKTVDLERGSWAGPGGPWRWMRFVLAILRYLRVLGFTARKQPLLVLWPIAGYVDMALVSRARSAPRLLLFHDPRPLRPQRGYGRWASRAARATASSRRFRIVTHSDSARAELACVGFDALVVLHPLGESVHSRIIRRRRDRPTLTVAGSYKPARDLDLLAALPSLMYDWELCLIGRAWPEVAGWQRRAWFHEEHEFDAALRESDVVFIPYARYYASGVLLRAVEQRVPVVSIRNGFAEEVLGPDWPGLVDDWTPAQVAGAIYRAYEVNSQTDAVAERYARACEVSWRALLGVVAP